MSFKALNLKVLVVAFVTGVLFAIGLALSGMTSPHPFRYRLGDGGLLPGACCDLCFFR